MIIQTNYILYAAKKTFFLIAVLLAIFFSCKKKDTQVSPPSAGPKADFFYKNPRGEMITDSIINIPYVPVSSSHGISSFENKYGGSPDLFKWIVIDSITNVQYGQGSAGNKFAYSSNRIGTQLLKLYTYKIQDTNNPNKIPIDSMTKVLHVSNRKYLKSIEIDHLDINDPNVSNTAEAEIFVRVYKNYGSEGLRIEPAYYETPHLQNIKNLSANIQIPVDTSIVVPSNLLAPNRYIFILCAVYKGRTYEILSNAGYLVESRQSQIATSSNKSQLLESIQMFYKEIPSMMTITTSYTYMKGK